MFSCMGPIMARAPRMPTAKNFCRALTLRQTVILIGIVDLILSAIEALLMGQALYLLATFHPGEDSGLKWEQSDHRNLNHRKDFHYHHINEIRILHARDLSNFWTDVFFANVILAVFHLITSILLICGAAMRKHQYIQPWLYVMTILLILWSGVMFAELLGHDSVEEIVFFVTPFVLYFCLTLVVLRYYILLKRENRKKLIDLNEVSKYGYQQFLDGNSRVLPTNV